MPLVEGGAACGVPGGSREGAEGPLACVHLNQGWVRGWDLGWGLSVPPDPRGPQTPCLFPVIWGRLPFELSAPALGSLWWAKKSKREGQTGWPDAAGEGAGKGVGTTEIFFRSFIKDFMGKL